MVYNDISGRPNCPYTIKFQHDVIKSRDPVSGENVTDYFVYHVDGNNNFQFLCVPYIMHGRLTQFLNNIIPWNTIFLVKVKDSYSLIFLDLQVIQ